MKTFRSAGWILYLVLCLSISHAGGQTLVILHTFATSDGASPYCTLIQGSDSNFYGTTEYGGANNMGTVFRISPNGIYAILYSFGSQPNDGVNPEAGLVQGSDGNFYGTTLTTVFRLTIPLNPPANQISAAQISGNDLALSVPSVAGETYQLQFTTDPACGNWSNVPGASVTNSIGDLLTLTNSGAASQPQGFYRFVITP